MTFIAGNLTQWNAAPTVPTPNLPQWWGYYTTDAIATVQAASYFNLNFGMVIGRNTTWRVGDQLYCVCSDGVTELEIATIGTTVTTVAGNANIPAASITTAMLQNAAVTTAKIADANVTLAKLAAGIAPSHVIKYSGQPTTVGGAAAEAFAIPGVLVTDRAFVQIVNNGTGNVTDLQAVCTANTLTVTFSADPQADTVFNYQIIRAAV